MVLSKSAIILCAQFFCSMVAATYARALVDTVPYITFMGARLPNHSFVDLQQFGNTPNGTNVLLCHTDLDTCCDPHVHNHTGQWVLPNGAVLLSGQGVMFVYAAQGIEQQLDLAYDGMPESAIEGLFRCDVPTNANATVLKSVYVGVFNDDSSEWWGIYTVWEQPLQYCMCMTSRVTAWCIV